MSYHVNKETNYDDAENNTAVASAGSKNKTLFIFSVVEYAANKTFLRVCSAVLRSVINSKRSLLLYYATVLRGRITGLACPES